MKKAIILLLLIAFATTSFGQQQPVSNIALIKADYLKKSKTQKTAAWICLGGGVAMFGLAGIVYGTMESDGGYTLIGGLFLIGTAAIITSIPLFIVSGKNKHKANLLITSQSSLFISPVAVSKTITGLTLSISL